MKVTVRDCLELSAFKGAQVVAGTSGLNNDVRSVSVLEATVPNEIKAYADDNGGMLRNSVRLLSRSQQTDMQRW